MDIRSQNREGFDAEKYGMLMSEAFLNEPNFTYTIPNLKKRRKGLIWFFGTFVSQLGFQLGKVYGTDSIGGQAVWISPRSQISFSSAMRAGFHSLPFQFGINGLSRFMTLGKYVEKLRKETAPKSSWYLMALGVSPALQGQGLGSALIQPILSQADKDHIPCYLETFTERNLLT